MFSLCIYNVRTFILFILKAMQNCYTSNFPDCHVYIVFESSIIRRSREVPNCVCSHTPVVSSFTVYLTCKLLSAGKRSLFWKIPFKEVISVC